MPDISNKKALIIIAHKNYQDHEFEPINNYLSTFGVEINIASTNIGPATGKFGGTVEVDTLLSDVHVKDYDAVIFIGGPGAVELKDKPQAIEIAKLAAQHCRVLAAICIAPTILARAGVLKNRKATVWSSPEVFEAINEIKALNAKYIDQPVVVDGNIITANGPQAAQEFAQKIAEKLAA